MKIGYAKQTFKYLLSEQLAMLKVHNCTKVHIQPINNSSYKRELIQQLEAGDILVVTRFIIIANDLQELLQILDQVEQKQIELEVIQQEFNSTKSIQLQDILSLLPQFIEDVRYQSKS